MDLEMKYALAVALSLLSTVALADPLSWYQAGQLKRDTEFQLDQLKQWATRAVQHCPAAKDFDRCTDEVEWKFDQRAAEIMRDCDARAAQLMQNFR
jgi:hypothetical protein